MMIVETQKGGILLWQIRLQRKKQKGIKVVV